MMQRPSQKTVERVERLARERAEREAKRVSRERLAQGQTQYIEWQEFYLWVRSILEVEKEMPDWLGAILNEQCPGFLNSEAALSPAEKKNRPLPLRLEDWIEERIFGFAKAEGWFNAIQYYAIRDPRYQRAEVCWSECVRKWEKQAPARYPSFEQWELMASQCDDMAHLSQKARRARAASQQPQAK